MSRYSQIGHLFQCLSGPPLLRPRLHRCVGVLCARVATSLVSFARSTPREPSPFILLLFSLLRFLPIPAAMASLAAVAAAAATSVALPRSFSFSGLRPTRAVSSIVAFPRFAVVSSHSRMVPCIRADAVRPESSCSFLFAFLLVKVRSLLVF